MAIPCRCNDGNAPVIYSNEFGTKNVSQKWDMGYGLIWLDMMMADIIWFNEWMMNDEYSTDSFRGFFIRTYDHEFWMDLIQGTSQLVTGNTLVGGSATPLKNDGVRQLGWWQQPNINGKIKFMATKPPTSTQLQKNNYQILKLDYQILLNDDQILSWLSLWKIENHKQLVTKTISDGTTWELVPLVVYQAISEFRILGC